MPPKGAPAAAPPPRPAGAPPLAPGGPCARDLTTPPAHVYAGLVVILATRHFCRACGHEAHEHQAIDAAAAGAGGGGGGGGGGVPIAQGPLAPPQDATAVAIRELDSFAARPVCRDDVRARDSCIASLRVALFDGCARALLDVLRSGGPRLSTTYTPRPTLTGPDLEIFTLRMRRVRETGVCFVSLLKMQDKHVYASAPAVDKSRAIVVKHFDYELPAPTYIGELILSNTARALRMASLAEAAPSPAEYSHDHALFFGIHALASPPNTMFRDIREVFDAKVEDSIAKKPSTFIDQAGHAARMKKRNAKQSSSDKKRSASSAAPRSASSTAPNAKSRRRARSRDRAAAHARTNPPPSSPPAADAVRASGAGAGDGGFRWNAAAGRGSDSRAPPRAPRGGGGRPDGAAGARPSPVR